jgi:nucleoside 2-deoxyribosyltransferase
MEGEVVTTRIYLAAKFERRTEIRPIRDALWTMGHEVVSTWIDEVKRPEGMSSDVFKKKLAVKDVAEIESADLFILDTFVVSEHGGTGVEFGLALGQFQRVLVYIVGPTRNVFHYLCDRQFENWNDCLATLKDH